MPGIGSYQVTNRMRVRGLVVMIVACQVMDPGSIPGERTFFLSLSYTLSYTLSRTHSRTLALRQEKKKEKQSGQPESNQ